MHPLLVALIIGALIGLYFGLRMGGWLAFFKLGQYEMKQRMFRARSWRRF